jgi:hypothetical protein
MSAVLPPSRTEFDRQGTYRIDVLGRIPAEWCDRLEGMAITECPAEAEPPVTSLLGELADQAALAGVLSTLFELHLSVIAVERITAV